MMKICEYKLRSGEQCKEEALSDSKYCILHTDLPEDEESEEFKRIKELKDEKVKGKASAGDFNFEGAKLFAVNLSGMKIENSLNFTDAVIRADVQLNEAKISGYASFDGAKICRDAWFNRAKIDGYASFDGVDIDGYAWFVEAEIGGYALFDEAEIGGYALFARAKIDGYVSFVGAKIDEYVSFNEAEIGGYASFEGAEIGEYAWFNLTEIKGELIFKNAKFKIPKAQEEACRKAKRICEELGNREEADYYFYREMEAKRIQKNRIMGFLELPIQYVFGYGTKWVRILVIWLLVVSGFAFIFWIGNGVKGANSLWENIYFSIVTATTLGYGDYHPRLGFYQGVASVEAIFGAFMWAAFVVIFARKYMR